MAAVLFKSNSPSSEFSRLNYLNWSRLQKSSFNYFLLGLIQNISNKIDCVINALMAFADKSGN